MPFKNRVVNAQGTVVVPQIQSPNYDYVDIAHITGWKLSSAGVIDAGSLRSSNITIGGWQAWAYGSTDPDLARGVSTRTININNSVYPPQPSIVQTSTANVDPVTTSFATVVSTNISPGPGTYQYSGVLAVPKLNWLARVHARVCVQAKVAAANWISIIPMVNGVQAGPSIFRTVTGLNRIDMIEGEWVLGNWSSAYCDYLIPAVNTFTVDFRIRSITAGEYRILGSSSASRLAIEQRYEWLWN